MTKPATSEATNLEDALAAAAKAQAAADQAQAVARQARTEADQRRAEAFADHDRRVVAEYNPEADDSAIAAALGQVTQAVENDPVWQALAALHSARQQAYDHYTDADRAARELGVNLGHGQRSPAGDINLEELLATITRTAAARSAAARETVEAARTEAGDNAARGT